MTNLITRFVAEVLVEQQLKDGYINATKLSRAYHVQTGIRREVAEWLSNARTVDSLNHLSRSTGIPVNLLTHVVRSGKNEHRGTYIHPRLAVRFAIWLSDDYGLMVEEWVAAWMVESALHGEARQLGKETRGIETAALQKLGFNKPHHYINITQAVYRGLFGVDAATLRKLRGVPKNASLRDFLTRLEIKAVDMMEESLAVLMQTRTFSSFTELYEVVRGMCQKMGQAIMLPPSE